MKLLQKRIHKWLEKNQFRIVLNASMSERKVIFNQDVKEGMLTSIRFCVCVCACVCVHILPTQTMAQRKLLIFIGMQSQEGCKHAEGHV